MKIGFLGVGSAFTTRDYYHSNLVVTAGNGKALLIDCGSDARFSLAEFVERNGKQEEFTIDGVYVTHLHADHVGGLEWLAITSYFSANRHKPKLFAEENMIKRLWRHTLRGGLASIQDKSMELSDYFELNPLARSGSFPWEGITFELFSMPHITAPRGKMESFGLIIRQTGATDSYILFTADTQFYPEFILERGHNAAMIFQDCETTPYKTTVHAHYEDLRTLPEAIRGKMWLYGYQPHPPYDAVADGFRGFVKKGQEFVV